MDISQKEGLMMAVLTQQQKDIFYHRNYAHRGLHTKDRTVPENSLAAFRRAAEKGYGIELDVQLSRDGQVVVFHDDTLDRVTGVVGRVDSYDYEDLKKMHLCGTKETIPLFTEVLKNIKGAGPLIVELKTGPRNNELCEKTLAILKTFHQDFCIESFNPFIVAWFRKHAPEIVRGQLASGYDAMKKVQPGLVARLLSSCFFNFTARPHFIAHQIGPHPAVVDRFQKKGGLLFGWTAHERSAESYCDGMIFEFYEPELKY